MKKPTGISASFTNATRTATKPPTKKLGNEDYTVRFTVGKGNGNWYYDQALTKIEKGELIERVRKQISLSSVNNSPNGFADKRLLELLQEKISEDNYKASFGAKNRQAEMSFKRAVKRDVSSIRGRARAIE